MFPPQNAPFASKAGLSYLRRYGSRRELFAYSLFPVDLVEPNALVVIGRLSPTQWHIFGAYQY